MKFFPFPMLALLLCYSPSSPAQSLWDYDSTVQVLVQEWRYVAALDAADAAPKIPREDLAVVTLPWSVARTRAAGWFQADVAIPEVWGDTNVVLSLESSGPVVVLANGVLAQRRDGTGSNEFSIPLSESIHGGDTVSLAIRCTHGDRPAQLIKVKLQGEPLGLTRAMDEANSSFSGIKDYGASINPWKRKVKGPDDAYRVDFDDSAWEDVQVGDEWPGDYVPAWYRGRLTMPAEVAGVPVGDERPLLALDFDDPADCFINGEKTDPVEKDYRGSIFALPEGTMPGDSFNVAFRILNRWGGGKLRQATWRLASIDEGFMIKRDLQVELNRVAVTIRAHDKPETAWVDAINALAAPLKTAQQDLTTFTATLEAAQEAFEVLADDVASDPVLLVPPYLQDVRPTEITVCFETSAPVPSRVACGRDALDLSVEESESYERIHKIILSNLKPDTTYQYQVAAGRQQTPIRTFKTAPGGTAPFNFLVWGDNQEGYKMAERVARAMGKTDADFVMSVGDVVGRGINWDEWTYQYLIPARYFMGTKPSFIAMGNHEYGGYDGNGNVAAFDYYFKHPKTSPGSNQYWYSFDYANAHFVVLEPLKMKWSPTPDPVLGNTVVPDDPELVWLEQDLKANQGKHDWTFVFYHEPAFAQTWSGGYFDGEDFIRNSVVPILEKYDVDMVFNGHTHAYERGLPHPAWNPVTREGNGITYIITGGGGGGLDNHKYKEWDKMDLPDHPAVSDSDAPDEGAYYRHHYCDVKVDGKTLTFKAQEVLPNGRLGRVLDDFKLQK